MIGCNHDSAACRSNLPPNFCKIPVLGDQSLSRGVTCFQPAASCAGGVYGGHGLRLHAGARYKVIKEPENDVTMKLFFGQEGS